MNCKYWEPINNDERNLCGLSHGAGKFVCQGMCESYQDKSGEDALKQAIKIYTEVEELRKRVEKLEAGK
jgi:hypothetical protein